MRQPTVIDLNKKKNEQALRIRRKQEERRQKSMITVGEVEQILLPLQAAGNQLFQSMQMVNVYMTALQIKGLLTEDDLKAAAEQIKKDTEEINKVSP